MPSIIEYLLKLNCIFCYANKRIIISIWIVLSWNNMYPKTYFNCFFRNQLLRQTKSY